MSLFAGIMMSLYFSRLSHTVRAIMDTLRLAALGYPEAGFVYRLCTGRTPPDKLGELTEQVVRCVFTLADREVRQ